MKHSLLEKREKAILVGIRRPNQNREDALESLRELESLTDTAGGEAVDINLVELREIHPATFIGKGKAEELFQKKETFEETNLFIFDEDLSPTQQRNLEQILKTKVIDRSGLILDIFAQRARTKEGKLQVELAQALYLAPRIVGKGASLSQQGGGIGTRGPGETQLEMDRRRIKEKISKIRKELEEVRQTRQLHRHHRLDIPIPTVSLIGYTNAGKSTLFRALTEENVLVEDKLFATLDPTVRRIRLLSGREILLADTVGFIRRLPHQLIESFKATFEEIAGSETLIHVMDYSSRQKEEQKKQVYDVLKEIDLEQKPVIEVFNKIDLLGETKFPKNKGIYLSAEKHLNFEELLKTLDQKLAKGFKKIKIEIPYNEGSKIDFLHRYARITSKEFCDSGVKMEVEVYRHYLPFLKKFELRKS